MGFVDTALVKVKGGDGGRGIVSFRHEKFVDRGGPDGGDGGRGGDVVFVAAENVNTLANFRHKQELSAEPGENGSKRKRHGKSGSDLKVEVPVGTVVKNEDQVIADLTESGQTVVVASGGDGGYGNAHFKSSRRQAPRVAEKGEPGDAFEATLELKLLADVGLVGLPNAGKSTLLSVVSNAHPEIADYPFTTIQPNLGVADIDDSTLLIADIPGLIAGASEGKGLGDDFLRHVERTAVLVHVIDAYSENIDEAYKTIIDELKSYRVDLSERPMIVALSKTEGFDEELLNSQIKALQKAAGKTTKIIPVSAQAGIGLNDLLKEALKAVKTYRKKEAKKQAEITPTYRLPDSPDAWEIKSNGKGKFRLTGKKIERFARRTDFESEFGIRRLRDIMHKMGIIRELEKRGIEPGDTISFKGVDNTINY